MVHFFCINFGILDVHLYFRKVIPGEIVDGYFANIAYSPPVIVSTKIAN